MPKIQDILQHPVVQHLKQNQTSMCFFINAVAFSILSCAALAVHIYGVIKSGGNLFNQSLLVGTQGFFAFFALGCVPIFLLTYTPYTPDSKIAKIQTKIGKLFPRQLPEMFTTL